MIEIKPFQRLRTGVLSKFVAVILVVTAVGGTYLAYEEYRSNRLALTVREAFAARRIEEARGPLRNWLAIRPGSGEALSYRLDQATRAIERWRSLAPDDPDPYMWSNEIASRGSAEPAILIQNFRAALERDPMNTMVATHSLRRSSLLATNPGRGSRMRTRHASARSKNIF